MPTSHTRNLLWVLALTPLIGIACADAADYVTMSGKELYATFCVSCHGATARGDGPVAAAIPNEVPDLTLLARRHGGAFPRDLVERIIDGRHVLAGHGKREMPIWGDVLPRAAIGDPNAERASRIVTGRLADYLWLLQRPATPATAAPVASDRGKQGNEDADKAHQGHPRWHRRHGNRSRW